MDQLNKFAVSGGLQHISKNNTADERSRRIAALTKIELTAYTWLFEGYSEAWTAETLGLEKQDAKKLYQGIYRKLGITNSREIINYYTLRHITEKGVLDEESI